MRKSRSYGGRANQAEDEEVEDGDENEGDEEAESTRGKHPQSIDDDTDALPQGQSHHDDIGHGYEHGSYGGGGLSEQRVILDDDDEGYGPRKRMRKIRFLFSD